MGSIMPISQDGVATMTLTFQDRGDHDVWQSQSQTSRRNPQIEKDPKRNEKGPY